MSITDPIKIEFYKRRGTYILVQGSETFYNEDRELREWGTAEEAALWAKENLGIEINQDHRRKS